MSTKRKYDELFEQFKSVHKKEGEDAAFSYLDDCIKQNPNCPEAYLIRGEVYSQIDFQQAIEDFEKAIRIEPNMPQSYFSRGVLYANSGDNNKAFSDFSKVIELDANYAEAYANRANMYLKLREPQKAINDCTKAIELSQDNFEPYFNRGLAYANTGEFAKALDDYNKVIELAPENSEAYAKCGLLHQQLGNVQDAIRSYEKFLELDPNNKNATLVRDALSDLRSGKISSEGTLISKKSKLPKIIIMIIGAIIFGGVIGGVISSDRYMTSTDVLIGVLIGAFFGLGIGPFFAATIGFLRSGNFWNIIDKNVAKEEAKDREIGCIIGLFKGLLFGCLILVWELIKSPFVAISQLVSDE